jgi:hypothetical protein
MNLQLFEQDWGVDNSPLDDTQITTTILYFSIDELKEFKELCKNGMKKEFPNNFKTNGNLSDLLLLMLRKNYGNI